MKVHVHLFGPAVEWAGESAAVHDSGASTETGVELEAAADATLGAIAGLIAQRWPRLGHVPGVRLALNRRFVALDHRVADGDEIAVIPPVSGG